MLTLYGHPFSSYTWKALIALYANQTPFTFAEVGPDHPDNNAFVAAASPQGKFPVLRDDDETVFEATSIIEHLHLRQPGVMPLIPADPGEAIVTRMIDRVFDLSVMNVMQEAVDDAIRNAGSVAPTVRSRVEERLTRSYRWINAWLAGYDAGDSISLIECAAAPSLFYADWTYPISDEFARLKRWRAHLLALPAVARCVDDARPYRAFFPLGAPDRD